MTDPTFCTPVDGFSTTLAAGRGVGGTTLSLASAAGLPTPTTSAPVRITCQRASDSALVELIAVAISGTTLTVTPPASGDIALAAGDSAGVCASAGDLLDLQAAILADVAAINELGGAVAALAPVASPALTGEPTAPTQPPGDDSTRLATTGFVSAAVSAMESTIESYVAGLNYEAASAVSAAIASAVSGLAPLASPAFTGSPTAPTPATSDSSMRIATTAFVKGLGYLTPTGNGSQLTGLTGSQVTGNIAGQAGTVATIEGLIAGGANVTITGAGTSTSPLTISASGGGGEAPGGSNGEIQYCDGSTFAGANITTDGTNLTLAASGGASITASGTSLTLQQTGDVFGDSVLELANHSGFNGVAFTTSVVGLVDLGFDTGTSKAYIRYASYPELDPYNNASSGEYLVRFGSGNTVYLGVGSGSVVLTQGLILARLHDSAAPVEYPSLYFGLDHLDGNGSPKLVRSDGAGHFNVIG